MFDNALADCFFVLLGPATGSQDDRQSQEGYCGDAPYHVPIVTTRGKRRLCNEVP